MAEGGYMEIEAELTVFLRDVDLVCGTALLTLTRKMGYRDALVALKRFDHYRFLVEVGEGEKPEEVAEALERALGNQSTFYNRNKHNYFLECTWPDGVRRSGSPLEGVRESLERDVEKALKKMHDEDSFVQGPSESLNLRGEKVFLGTVLVQEREDGLREGLAKRLSGELEGRGVEVTGRGVLWWLALKVRKRREALDLLEEITVTVRRDRGLLMNPNYQFHTIGGIEELAGG